MDAGPRLGGDSRFTDPRLARKNHDPAAARGCRLPGGEQHCDLCVTPDERRRRGGPGCKPADFPLADHLIGRDRPAEALQLLWPEVAIVEGVAGQLASHRRDDDAVRSGQGLQPRR